MYIQISKKQAHGNKKKKEVSTVFEINQVPPTSILP